MSPGQSWRVDIDGFCADNDGNGAYQKGNSSRKVSANFMLIKSESSYPSLPNKLFITQFRGYASNLNAKIMGLSAKMISFKATNIIVNIQLLIPMVSISVLI